MDPDYQAKKIQSVIGDTNERLSKYLTRTNSYRPLDEIAPKDLSFLLAGAGVSEASQIRNHGGGELNLLKMGFTPESSVEWDSVEIPPKTDLHKLLHYRITNFISPDILVKIGNHEYRCHLMVLQCYSGFFVENAVSRIEILENQVSKSAFTSIYEWMLHPEKGSHNLLKRENLLDILMAARYLRVEELEEQCHTFIDNEDLFSEDKAFLLYMECRARGLTEVMEQMVPRIQRFFLTLVASKDFLELEASEVADFLRSNYICVHCEMEVFMAAVRWLLWNWEARKANLVELMSCVRFGLIPPWQLVDMRRNPKNQEFLLVTREKDVSRMVEDGLAFAIIKQAHETSVSTQWAETLGLQEPTPRNWASTNRVTEQKKYATYREFLAHLAEYKQMHILANKGKGDKNKYSSEVLPSDDYDDDRKLIVPDSTHFITH